MVHQPRVGGQGLVGLQVFTMLVHSAENYHFSLFLSCSITCCEPIMAQYRGCESTFYNLDAIGYGSTQLGWPFSVPQFSSNLID